MTKKLLSIITAAVCLLGTACSRPAETPQTRAKSVLSLADSVYTSDKKKLNASWHNTTDKEITIGLSFTVEKHTDNGWRCFEPLKDMVFNTIGIQVKAGGRYDMTYDLSSYNFTESGNYCITAEYLVKDGERYTEHPVSAGFTVPRAAFSADSIFTQELYKKVTRIDCYLGSTPTAVTDRDKIKKIYKRLSSLTLTEADSSAEEKYGHTAVDIITEDKTIHIGLLSGEVVVDGVRYLTDKDITEKIMILVK